MFYKFYIFNILRELVKAILNTEEMRKIFTTAEFFRRNFDLPKSKK